jgi:hypothetical protein
MTGRFDHVGAVGVGGVGVGHHGLGHAVTGGVHGRPGIVRALVAQWQRRWFRRGRSRRAGDGAGLDLGRGGCMSAVEGILLAVSVIVFAYLGVAMFRPEWF